MKWFRFYSDALDNPKVQRLPGELFKAWVNILCLANRSKARGVLPPLEDVAFALRLSEEQAAEVIAELVRRGLLDERDDGTGPHDWLELQPEYETPRAAAERKRRQRDRDKKSQRSHSDSHAKVTRQKKNREELQDANASLSSSAEPNVDRAESKESSAPNPVREVFDYWRVRCDHPQATLTQDRKAKIKARLNRYSVADLKRAIDHAAESPFYQGDNDRQTRYDFPETIFKNDGATERLIYASNGNGGGKPKPVIVHD